MENKVKGIDDVRFNGQADQYHCNGCKYNRERGKISKDQQEEIDIKKATASRQSVWLLI